MRSAEGVQRADRHAPDASSAARWSGGPCGPFRDGRGRIIGGRRPRPAATSPIAPERPTHDHPDRCHRRPDHRPHGHRRRVRRCGRRRRRSTSSTRPRAPSSRPRRSADRPTSTGRSRPRRRAFDDRKGWAHVGRRQARPDAGEVRGPASRTTREELAQLESRNVGKPITGARGEITGVEPRLRLLRRRRQQDLRPDDPGLEARPRPDPARADRRRRAHRAVELPAADGLVEGRAGAGRRQHGDPQARQLLPVDGDPARRAGARGGDPGRRPQRRDRARAARPARPSRPTRASARSPSPARPRPARRSCGWRRAT